MYLVEADDGEERFRELTAYLPGSTTPFARWVFSSRDGFQRGHADITLDVADGRWIVYGPGCCGGSDEVRVELDGVEIPV